MGEHDNAGFPLSYCLLSTATAVEIGKRTKALTAWADCLCDTYGVIPVFAHVDKDMAEIGMLQTSWVLKIQLCWWHMRKAVRERLGKGKLSTTPYDVKRAHAEFPFIRCDFVPSGSADITEYEGGNLDKTREDQLPPDDPNAIHIRLTVPPSLRTPSTAPPTIPIHPKPRTVLGDHAKTNSKMPTLAPIPPNTPGNSGLTIKLLAGRKEITTLRRPNQLQLVLWQIKQKDIPSALPNTNSQSSTCSNSTIVHTHLSLDTPILVERASEHGL
jgi:hypothetical protein